MSDSHAIRVAVVGAGHLGRHHVRLAATLPGWECVGVLEPDPVRREAVCQEFRVSPLGNLEEAIERAEAAVVATPTESHSQVAGAFLAAGRHVLVEKPIASSLHEARELTRLAAAKQVVLAVGHVEFFNPAVQAILARRPRPRFLEAQRLSPFTRRSLDIDVVFDLMVHDIQIAQALNPSFPVREVRAVGVPVLSGRVDLANVRLEFANGCIANLTASRVSAKRVRKLRLFEPDAYFSVDYAEQSVSAARLTRDGGESAIVSVPVPVEQGEPLAAEHLAFQRACRGLSVSIVDGEAGTAALATAAAVMEAITAAAG